VFNIDIDNALKGMSQMKQLHQAIASQVKILFANTLVWLLLIVCSVVGLCLPVNTAVAATDVATVQIEDDRQLVLAVQKYLFWQQVNAARRNPLAVVERLGLPLAHVQRVLGADSWILEQGLPPLAWNDQLNLAASFHGRDMIDEVYYDHISLEGLDVQQRAEKVGYQAEIADETLGLLIFDRYVEYDRAIEALVDNMLRDELVGTVGVWRNIFSPEYTEVGISFFAENLPSLAGQPYVYLLVVDFAQPVEQKSFVVGVVDTDCRLAVQQLDTGFWDFLPQLPQGGFQFALPQGGVRLLAFDEQNIPVYDQLVEDEGFDVHLYINLKR